MDFYQIRSKETKDKGLELYPDFIIGRSQDLMVQGRTFYAIWDAEKGLWSRDEYDVQRLVDEDLQAEADKLFKETGLSITYDTCDRSKVNRGRSSESSWLTSVITVTPLIRRSCFLTPRLRKLITRLGS
jgi:hypothetical protein